MEINKYFDAVFCISLDKRPDRRKQAEYEFEKYNIPYVQFVSGIDGKSLNLPKIISSDGSFVSCGDIGCVLSHLKCVKIAKLNELKNYLVYEDDCEHVANFNELFSSFITQVPDDWEILYLGHSINGTKHFIHNNVVRATNVFTTHAVAFKHTIYDSLIEIWESRNEKVDVALATLQSKFNTYAFEPFLVGQRPSYSDILEKETNYKHLRV